jgi:integrase
MQRGEVFRRPDRPGWSARWYDKSGQRRTKGGWHTKGEAADFLTDVLKKQRLGVLYQPDRDFNELVEEYLEQYSAATGTRRNLVYALNIACEALGETPLHELETKAITKLKAKAESERGPHARWKIIRGVKQVLAEAKRWGWIATDPSADIKNPQPPAPVIWPFQSWNEIDAIAAEMELFPEIAVLAAGTGLRPEEWVALQKRDIDLAKKVLYVRRVYVDGEEKELGKQDKSRRRVPLRQRVVDVLEPVMTELSGDADPVFPGERAKYLHYPSWRRDYWHSAVKAAGLLLPDGGSRRPYDLRHTYASFSLAAGINGFALAKRMGTSFRMIERTYGHLLEDADELERALLDEFDSGLA